MWHYGVHIWEVNWHYSEPSMDEYYRVCIRILPNLETLINRKYTNVFTKDDYGVLHVQRLDSAFGQGVYHNIAAQSRWDYRPCPKGGLCPLRYQHHRGDHPGSLLPL